MLHGKTVQSDYVLTDFISIEALQALQDSFARLTGIVISFRDARGKSLTRPSEQFILDYDAASASIGEVVLTKTQLAELDANPVSVYTPASSASIDLRGKHLIDEQHLGSIYVERWPDCSCPLPNAPPSQDSTSTGLARMRTFNDERSRAAEEFVGRLAHTLTQLCYHSYQLRCRIDDLTAIYGVAEKLSGRVELQEILDMSTRSLVETMGLKASGIRLLDEDTGVLRIASVCNLSKEYLDKGPIAASESQIDRDALNGQMVYVENLGTDPRTHYKEKIIQEGLVSGLIAPLKWGKRTFGVVRAYMGRPYQFTDFDRALMEGIASQIAAAIANHRLRQNAQSAEQLKRQVKLAADVQRRMIPKNPPELMHYRIGCLYEPTFDLGGDFYDFLEFHGGQTGVVIADVVGKGVPASLMMASTKAALRCHAKKVRGVDELMTEVNRRLWEDTLESEFVTAFCGILSPAGRSLRYCNAGHEPMILLRDGKTRELDVGGLVLGLDPDAHYEWAEQELEPGDLLVLVTDGVLEAMNYDEESFGRARFHQSIRTHGDVALNMAPDMIAKQILWDVRRFIGLAPLTDDITLVVIRVI